MRKLLSLLIFLYACNGAVQNKATADSTAAVAKTDSAAAVPAPAAQQLSVELTGIPEAEFDRYKQSDRNQIDNDTTKLHVVNGVLTIPSDKGGAVVFKNNDGVPHDEDKLSYSYHGYLKPLNKYLVGVSGYEHAYCLMVDKTTGKKDTVSNIPAVSPDGKLLICSRYNPYEEYEHIPPPTGDISIYAVENNDVKRIFIQPYRWFVRDLYWKDNRTVYIKTRQKEGDDAATTDYIQLAVVSGTDTLNASPVNASWKGTYSTVLNESSSDSRDHINVDFKVDGNTVMYTESGFQVYNKYLLAATEKDGQLFFTFKKVEDGGDRMVETEKRFGHIEKEDGKYKLYCPYLDSKMNGGNRMSYPLRKK